MKSRQRTGFNKGMCFRLLYTLHECGFLDKVGDNQYRLVSEQRPSRSYRIGYASQGQDCSFVREVLASIERAAEEANVELIVADNRYDAKTALRSADQLVHENVDLVIEFQADEAVAPAIAAKYMEADSFYCHRHSSPGCDLLWREQLRSRHDGGPPPGALGEEELVRRSGRDPVAGIVARRGLAESAECAASTPG